MFRQLKEIYGIKFLIYLVIIQLFGKGLLYGLIGSLVLPVYQLIGVDGLNYQLYSTIAEIPWSLKPIFGVLSDLFVIGGYNKRYWILFGNLIGSLFALILAIFFQSKNPILICFCFFAMELQVALQDLMTEAKYAEIMRNNPESGSSIVSFVNALNSMGTFISVIIVGILADQHSYITYTILFYVCFAITLFPIMPTILGWLPEIKNSKLSLFTMTEDSIEDNLIEANDLSLIENFYKDRDIKKKIYALVFGIGIMSIVISVVFVFSTLAVTILTGISLILGILLGYKVFDKIVMNAILYRCLTYITYWGLSGAMDYFYTASNECVPNGPHFSYEYYITWTGLIGALISFLGAFIYQALFGKSNIRTTLVITTIISGLFSCFDLIIVKRWNLAIGIPDKVMYMFGDAICYNLIDMLSYIPLMTLISKVCPEKLETTTYAFVSGISNLARILSYLIGSYAIQWFKISTVVPCNFDYLWLLIIIGHIALGMLVLIPCIFLLIPNVKPTDNVIEIK